MLPGAPGNIRQRLNADERHTANADIRRKSREESKPEQAVGVVQLVRWRQGPHPVEQHGWTHVTVDWGQGVEQLRLLVVVHVVQLQEPGLELGVRVISRRSEKIRNSHNGTLREGLDNVVVLRQRSTDAAGGKRRLVLGEP